MRRLWPLAAMCLASWLAGCAQKRSPLGYYQLRGVWVVPPAGAKSEFRSARQTRRKGCDASAGSFAVNWKGRTALVKTSGLEMDEAGRMPVVLSKSIDDFRDSLARLESNKCLKPGEGPALLMRITEELSLPSPVAYELAHASSPYQGYVDIEQPFRLKLVSPLRANGQISGFETARYSVRRGVLAPIGAEGQTVRLSVPAGTKYLRLFFLTRRSPAEHDAILVPAPDSAALAQASDAIKRQGEDYCRAQVGRCLVVPREVGLSAELPIRANGQLIGVPVRGTVRDALKEAGVPDPVSVIKSLRVTRPYKGKPIPIQFDDSARDILGLMLIGGEELNWQ